MRTSVALFATIFTAAGAVSAAAADLRCAPYDRAPGCHRGPPAGVIVEPPTFGQPLYVVDQGPTLSGPGITVYGSVWTANAPLRRYPFVVSRGGYIAGGYR